jgi:outer membrane receptor protein involved in Fe transport
MLRILLLASSLLAAPAAAQEPVDGLPDNVIIVTGEGLRAGLGEDVYDSVSIDRDRLTGAASNRLDEILKEVPGFQLFRRSDARSANPTSQGATLRALGGNASSRALLLLDGVPQTDPFGGWVSWPAYDPQRLGAVRVVRGGGSGANGPGALAGTIELISARPSELEGLGAALAYGSRDSLDARAGAGLALGAGFLSLSGSYARGDGFVPVVEEQRGPVDRASPYEQASASLRAVAPLSDAVELQANGLWFSDDRERGTAFSEIATTGADASLRLVGPRWQALAYVQTRDFYNSFASVNAARTSVSQASEQYNVPSTGLGARFELRPSLGRGAELRLGGDWRQTEGETRERFNFQNGIGTRGRVAGGRTTTLGAFAEAALERGPFTLTGGGRIDRWRIQDGFLDERVFATGQVLTDTDFSDRAGWEPTGRAGLAWRPGEAVTLRAAGYLGWRLPTLNELYRPFRVGADATAANAALAPERLRGIEAGIELRPLADARLGLTLFANRLTEGIANVTLGRGPGLFPGAGFVAAGGEYRQRQNIDAIDVRGIELDGSFRRGPWRVSAGYSYADAEVEADGAASPLDGLRPAQTPRHSAAASLGWHGGTGARAALTVRYTGAQYEDDLNEQSLPDALTFDAAAALPLTRALSLEARAENLGDERVVAGISGNGIIERATPRTLWIGLVYRH